MKRKIVILSLLIITLTIFAQEKATFFFRSMPYLQNMNNTGVTVISVASGPSLSYVRLGESSDLKQQIFASKHVFSEAIFRLFTHVGITKRVDQLREN